MKTYNLGFISDINFYLHVKETIDKYRFKINLENFNKNLIDPIKLTFDAKVYKKDIKDVVEAEIIRQVDKSNTNHIGYFHQNIFKYINSDWEVPLSGYDIINKRLNIYVEMKNKHNTMNSSSSQKTYMRMQNTIIKNPKAKCMLVEVIAKNSQDTVWSTTLDGSPVFDKRIRRISIDKFYEIVTGQKYAFKELCEKLPIVIDDVIKNSALDNEQNTVFDELLKISPHLLKSLYLLSFEKYEGFENFNV